MNHTKHDLPIALDNSNRDSIIATNLIVDNLTIKPRMLLSPGTSYSSRPSSRNCSPHVTPLLPFTHSPISRNSSMPSRRNSLTEHLELPRLNTSSPNSRNSSRPDSRNSLMEYAELRNSNTSSPTSRNSSRPNSRNSLTPNNWAKLGADSRGALNMSTDSYIQESNSKEPEHFKSCLNINDSEQADKIILAIESGLLDPNETDIYGRTYLMALMCPKVIEFKDDKMDKRLIILNKLLALGADINATEKSENRAAIHYAAQYRNITMLKWLYKNNADFSKRLINGNSVIHEAILGKGVPLKTESNIVKIIEFVLKINPNLINFQGICQLSPLELSVYFNRKQSEKHLRSYNNLELNTLGLSNVEKNILASPNNTYKINYRRSSYSIFKSKNSDPIIQLKLYILFKLQEEFENYFNQTKSILESDDKILEMLVFCMQQKKFDKAKYVYNEMKYNIIYTDKNGLSVIEYAIRYKWYDFFDKQQGFTNDYDFNRLLKKRMTAAMLAARYSDKKMIEIIANRGSNLLLQDDKGRNVFAHATTTKHNIKTNVSNGKCVELLLERTLTRSEIKVQI